MVYWRDDTHHIEYIDKDCGRHFCTFEKDGTIVFIWTYLLLDI